MTRPADYLPAFEEALREVVAQQDPTFAKTMPLSLLKIGLQGAFGSHHVSPRGLGAPLLNSAVCVEGIVTKCATLPCAAEGRGCGAWERMASARCNSSNTSNEGPCHICLLPLLP